MHPVVVLGGEHTVHGRRSNDRADSETTANTRPTDSETAADTEKTANTEETATATSPPVLPSPPIPGTNYEVRPGDYLRKIAKKFYGNEMKWRKIYDANQSVIGPNPDRIYPGQKLVIPL